MTLRSRRDPLLREIGILAVQIPRGAHVISLTMEGANNVSTEPAIESPPAVQRGATHRDSRVPSTSHSDVVTSFDVSSNMRLPDQQIFLKPHPVSGVGVNSKEASGHASCSVDVSSSPVDRLQDGLFPGSRLKSGGRVSKKHLAGEQLADGRLPREFLPQQSVGSGGDLAEASRLLEQQLVDELLREKHLPRDELGDHLLDEQLVNEIFAGNHLHKKWLSEELLDRE